MNCVILGDKYQKGMKSKGCAALIRANKQYNLLENQYFTLKSIFPDIKINYIYGFDNKKFLDYIDKSEIPLKIIYNDHYHKYNHIFSLGLVSELFNDNLLIVDGYKLLTKKIFKKFNCNNSQVFVNKEHDQDSVGCVINKSGNIENFNFDLANSLENIYYIDKECSIAMKSFIENKYHYNHFIFEILNKLIDHGFIFKPQMQ